MKLRYAFTLVAGFVFAAAGIAQDEMKPTLAVGDPAPSLNVGKWVKGQPVKSFEKGKLYVVEFWATWCGPCKMSIPHLTELQKKYSDVKFVGVSVWENKQKDVEPFVKEMGSKMAYTVATDKLPGGVTDANEGMMAKQWMQAAAQGGIPTAFVVDKDSKIAWIGHPMELDEPLSKIVAGNWDTKSFAMEAEAENAAKTKLMAYGKRISDAAKAKDDSEILKVYGEMIADDNVKVQAAGSVGQFAFLLMGMKDYDRAYAAARTAIEGPLSKDADNLNSLAWMIVDPEAKIEKRDLDVAMDAATKSVEIKKDYANVDTLARVYFLKGDKAKAIELQKEAISLAPSDEERKSLEATLKEYEG